MHHYVCLTRKKGKNRKASVKFKEKDSLEKQKC